MKFVDDDDDDDDNEMGHRPISYQDEFSRII